MADMDVDAPPPPQPPAAAAAPPASALYVTSAHRPTTVTHAVVGAFTGADERNLIIA